MNAQGFFTLDCERVAEQRDDLGGFKHYHGRGLGRFSLGRDMRVEVTADHIRSQHGEEDSAWAVKSSQMTGRTSVEQKNSWIMVQNLGCDLATMA